MDLAHKFLPRVSYIVRYVQYMRLFYDVHLHLAVWRINFALFWLAISSASMTLPLDFDLNLSKVPQLGSDDTS